MDSLDREYHQIVNAVSGCAIDNTIFPNVESAKDAAQEAAMGRDDDLAIVRVTVQTVATLAKTVTVEVTDVPLSAVSPDVK